jgi:hypothetical protein
MTMRIVLQITSWIALAATILPSVLFLAIAGFEPDQVDHAGGTLVVVHRDPVVDGTKRRAAA